MCLHSALANSQASQLEQQDRRNIWMVQTLYEALNSLDVETVHRLLTPNLEWWFHGPPVHQYLTRLLTGSSSSEANKTFTFVPLSITAFGSTVIVEGYNKEHSVSWVHAWTVTNEKITQVREYFNTSVTVTSFADGDGLSISSSAVTLNCQCVWQSKLCDNNSVPGLVLAL